MEKIIIGLLFVFLVLFPFGQLTKIPLNFLNLPEVHLYLTDVVLFLLVLGWGIWRFSIDKKKYHLPPLAKPIFLFIVLAGLSLAVNSPLFSGLPAGRQGREVGVGFLYLLRWIFYAGLYFILFDLKEKSRHEMSRIRDQRSELSWLKKDWSGFLIIIGSTVAIFALIQYFLWPNLKALEVLQYDPHFYRAVGTFLDPGFTGIILVLTLILLINNGLYRKSNLLWMIIVYIALALTYSRASWLAFFVGMTVIAFYKKSWKLFLFITGILALTWFLIPQPAGEGGKLTRVYTIQSRFQNYQQAVKIIKERPILGVGFNTLRYYQKKQGFLTEENWQTNQAGAGLDNSWLFILATTGILGFVSYLWLGWKALGRFKNILVVSSLTAVFIHSFFLNSLFYPWVMAWLWLLLAMENK
ncbi:MAG: O-antigen ligase family protein [Candidatus Shapirobacteria bacterium]|nr:O-antigen ligase family protein [Candidatus Shapirobacteria bacterium]